MKLKKFNILASLIIIAVVVLPFNDLPHFHDVLRELSNEGSAYPMLIAIGLFLWGSLFRKRDLPKHFSFWFLCLFIIWVILSGVLNFSTIATNITKGRSGIEKIIFQLILLAIMVSSSLVIYHVMKNHWGISGLYIFRNCVLGSFLIASFVGMIDMFHLFGERWASDLLLLTNPLIHKNPEILLNRLRSVSGEPSWYGMYMAFTFPWIFSYLLSEKRHRFLYLILVLFALVMTYFTSSRLSYISVIVELFLFIAILLAKAGRRVRRGALYVAGVVFILLFMIMFTSVDESVEKITGILSTLINSQPGEDYFLSNSVRFGSQQTAYNIGMDHPLIGVGFGQYGFYMPFYLPDYAYNSSEIIVYASFLDNTAWATTHGLFARLLAETGFIGLASYLMIWLTFLWACWSTYRIINKKYPRLGSIGLALILSTLGVLMVGFAAETFRFFGYWFTLAVGWYYFEIPYILNDQSKLTTNEMLPKSDFSLVENKPDL